MRVREGFRLRTSLVGSALAALFVAVPAHAITLPPNFADALVTNVGVPTALAFTPDGRLLIATQGGALRIFHGGSLLGQAALNLNVCSNSERGLLGVAVDPSFASNHFIYVYYTRDLSGSNNCNTNDPQVVNRVSRFTLPDTNVIDPATQLVLVDRMQSWNGNHNGGDVHFGKDGFLYISVGDGGCDYNGDSGCAGNNDAARDEHVLLGKILRITSSGGIPATNPFQGAGTARCNVNGGTTPGQRCQETFAWGLRNPFRMGFDPNDPGTRFFINDVGQNTWEEIDLGQSGVDYGWNCREGAHTNNTGGPCSPTPPNMVDPIFEYNHSTGCGSITGAAFVPPASWPAPYDTAYMYADYNCGKIFRLNPDGSGGYTSTSFATGLGGSSAVAMIFGPSGSGGQALYYTTYAGGGQVRKITFTGATNNTPTAVVTAVPIQGPAPLEVSFDGSGSSDPDGDALTYVWDFGEGDPPTETATPTISHVYGTIGVFTASLRVRDTSNALSDPDSVDITPGNSPPTPVITSPANGALFSVGQGLTLSGTATDAQDGTLPPSALSWSVLLHHNEHTHPYLLPTVGNGIPLTAPAPEDLFATQTSYLEIYLTATDSAGISRTVVRRMMPRTVNVSFDTSPPGLRLVVNTDTTLVAPQTLVSWQGYQLNVVAANQVDAGGHGRTFVSWSDGGAAAHTITTPGTAATYTANFALATAIGIDDVVVTEQGGTVSAVFTARLSDPTGQTVTASFATSNGSAAAGNDYTATSGGLTFGPSVTTQTLAVPVLADATLESTETFFVTLSGFANAVAGKLRGQGWILDAGSGPRVQFGAAAYAVGEGGTATITVRRLGGTTGNVSVDYVAGEGSASLGPDYTVSSGTLSFAPGVVSRMFTVKSNADALDEGEETVLLRLGNVGGGALGGQSTSVLTIRDNDSAGRLQFGAASFAADEAGPVAIVTVTRAGGMAGGVTVDYAASDGTANEGLDFGITSGTLSFNAGVAKQTFTVPLIDDGIVEGNETVNLSLSDPTGGATLGAPAAAVMTIQEGNPVLQFGAANFSAPESAPRAVIAVKRSGPTADTVTVDYATSDGMAQAGVNYEATSGTLTFGPGVTGKTFGVTILNDTAHENSLTVLLALSSPSTGSALGQLQTAVLAIGDNDPAGTLRFGMAGYRVSETASVATIRVARSGGTASAVTVDYTTVDGTALAGVDYTTTSGTLSFGAGVASRSFDVPLLPRGGFVGDRTLGLTLANQGGGASLGNPSAATLTILSDDPLLQFSAATYRVGEAGPQAIIMVKRSGPVGATVMVDYATSDGSATAGQDYTMASGTLTFGPGMATRTFAVLASSDALVEGDETVNLTLSNPQQAALGLRETAVLTLATESPKLQFSAAKYGIAESAPRATITVRRTPPMSPAVAVDFATADGSALAALDYETSLGTLSFGPGAATRTFGVPIIGDNADENAETVALSLSNPSNAILGSLQDATLTIGDDDVAGRIQFSVSDYSVSEAGPMATITVTRTGGRASGVTVDYATANGSAMAGTNYLPASGTLIFGAGEMSRTFAVEILDDGVAGGNTSVSLALSGPTGGASLGARTTSTLWIVRR